ncbi:MAG: lysophospholipid acyltransferase family protein, partial [Bacteroidota bacterium]|nr:lysophospholipid acyltransferase family protein [Bacteroidota bacterium]
MAKLLYLFLRFLTLLMHLFPLRVHYIVSDILCLFVKDIIGYRKKVVYKNLHNSFPEKDQKEIEEVASRFYHHFCDQIIEMLYFANISAKEIEKRISYSGLELIHEALDNNRPVIAMLGHYGNWEWLSSFGLKTDKSFFMLYKPLHSEGMDHFMKYMRSRQRAIPLPKDNAFRTLIGYAIRKKPTFSGFIADQTPKVDDIQHWVTFLNQPTAVFLGAEKIGRKTNSRIVFAHMAKPRRGYYHCDIYMIDDQPAQSPEYTSTE